MDTLDHVALAVSDIRKAIEWFTRMFRCEVAYENDTWALLRFANISVALVVAEQHAPHIAVLREEDAEKSARSNRTGTALGPYT